METEVPGNERLVYQGGLMRCCLQTIAEHSDLTKVGDVIHCKFETKDGGTPMVVDQDGHWKWDQPAPRPAPDLPQ